MHQRENEIVATVVPPSFVFTDVAHVVRLSVLALVAWILPSRAWPPLATLFASINARIRPAEMKRMTAEIAGALGDRAPRPPADIAQEGLAALYEDWLQLLRDYRPDGWRPETRIENANRIDAALSQGKGVILWVASFVFSSHITKMSLKRAGYAVTHLSRPTHGFSRSRFGIRALNPIQTRIEDRYIGERVEIQEDRPTDALRVLHGRLRGNGVVSITLNDETEHMLPAPFLAGTASIPRGPAELARMTGAVILPVCTVREERWRYTTHIGEPIAAPGLRGVEHDRAIARGLAAWLEPIILDYPALWKTWPMVTPDDGALGRAGDEACASPSLQSQD